MKNKVIHILNTNCEWFLGGSRRFDYFNDNSDYDFISYSAIFPEKELMSLGFTKVDPYQHMSIQDIRSYGKLLKENQLYKYKGKIHVLSVGHMITFSRMQREHNYVEKFLMEFPWMKDTARHLKQFMTGGQIYRTFLKMMGDYLSYNIKSRI